MSEDRVRVLRILEYTGPRSWVERALEHRYIKGEIEFGLGGIIIRETILHTFPEIIGKEEKHEDVVHGDAVGDES